MIKLVKVSKCYRKKILLNGINLKIDQAGLYSFIGANGSGKTTLLNIICKFIKVNKGKVINKYKRVSFVSQETNLLEHLTILEHFKMFKINPLILKKFHLFSKLNNLPKELSLGQKQRIATLLALYSSSNLKVFDEPTSHLDKYNASLIMKEIKKISKNKIVLLVSHEKESVYKYSDYIYEINDTKLNLIKEKHLTNPKIKKSKVKYHFTFYLFKVLKYHKGLNLLFFIIFFFLSFLFIFYFTIQKDLKNYISNNQQSILDYNKFYLKQCKQSNNIKQCFNLDEEHLKIIENNEEEISYNYELLMNYIYDTSKFNVIKGKDKVLKEGRYPLEYNEIITNDKYHLGDTITLSSFKVLKDHKTDLYSKPITLKVVGISSDSFLFKNDYYYLDYELLENYLKEEKLINNAESLYDYYHNLKIDNYKYIVYFKNINISLFTKNNIEYESTYKTYQEINNLLLTSTKSLQKYSIILILFSFYYLIKLLKKKIKSKNQEISFFKAMGLKASLFINKEQNFLIITSFLLSLIVNVLLFYFLFSKIFINIKIYLFILFSFLFVSRILVNKSYKRRVKL